MFIGNCQLGDGCMHRAFRNKVPRAVPESRALRYEQSRWFRERLHDEVKLERQALEKWLGQDPTRLANRHRRS